MIMVDGVRVAPTEYIGTIDTNVIPTLLLTRVDTVPAALRRRGVRMRWRAW
jgi:hypothetical protein